MTDNFGMRWMRDRGRGTTHRAHVDELLLRDEPLGVPCVPQGLLPAVEAQAGLGGRPRSGLLGRHDGEELDVCAHLLQAVALAVQDRGGVAGTLVGGEGLRGAGTATLAGHRDRRTRGHQGRAVRQAGQGKGISGCERKARGKEVGSEGWGGAGGERVHLLVPYVQWTV